MRLELQNSKRQCELVKSLLADATAEKEIMYEARPDLVYHSIKMLTKFLGIQRRIGWNVQRC